MDASVGTNGDFDEPEEKYVKLISSDDQQFLVKYEHAFVSRTIKTMLDGRTQCAPNEPIEIRFSEIKSHVLEKICQYFAYKVQYAHSKTVIPPFPIAPEMALDLMMAANFLDC